MFRKQQGIIDEIVTPIMIDHKAHICVCICTYKRPEMLLRLFSKIEEQETNNLFSYSIVVVDNDRLESARKEVESYAKNTAMQISYFVEIEQNISLSRNRALEKSTGDFIALIDDDEYPSKTWLLELYNTFLTLKPNGGILGPVIPYYPEGTPTWLLKSKICDRPNHSTGTKLDWNQTRAGNVLLLRKIMIERSYRFDPNLGRNGGEDKELFKRIMADGYTFVWCHEAKVYEVVYSARWKLSFYLKRSLLNGGDAGREHSKESPFYLFRCLGSFMFFAILLIISAFMGKNRVYKYFIRVTYDFARIMGCFKIAFIRVRHD